MDWSEYLIPIVVVIFWIIGEFFKGKGSDDGDAPPRRAPRPVANDDDDVTRRIQEEIRRKIAERANKQNAGNPERSTPSRTQTQRQYTPPPVVREKKVQQPMRREEPALNPFSDAKEQIERNLRKADDAKRQLQQTQKKEMLITRNATRDAAANIPKESTVRQDVLAMLSNRSQAQRAFVLQEVLGTPVGMRRNEASQNLWER